MEGEAQELIRELEPQKDEVGDQKRVEESPHMYDWSMPKVEEDE